MVERVAGRATVSVAEYQRLERNLAELAEQFEAANEVLSAMVHSSADPEAVMTIIVESARRLCRSQAAQLYVLENGVYQLIKAVGLSEKSIRFIAEHPMPVDRGTLLGRVGTGPHNTADRRRSGGPRLQPPRPPEGCRVQDHHGSADAPR